MRKVQLFVFPQKEGLISIFLAYNTIEVKILRVRRMKSIYIIENIVIFEDSMIDLKSLVLDFCHLFLKQHHKHVIKIKIKQQQKKRGLFHREVLFPRGLFEGGLYD